MSKMSIQEFVNDISSMKRRMVSGIRNSLYVDVLSILEEIKARSPIDENIFRTNWELRRISSDSCISGFSISNSTLYAPYLDEGATPGGSPWYWPNSKSGGNVSNSGKLTVEEGRVWAGGKSPSGFVIGGIIDPIIYKNSEKQLKIATNIANAVVEAI